MTSNFYLGLYNWCLARSGWHGWSFFFGGGGKNFEATNHWLGISSE